MNQTTGLRIELQTCESSLEWAVNRTYCNPGQPQKCTHKSHLTHAFMHFKQMLCYVLNYNFAFQPSVFPHNNTPSIMLKAMTWSVRLCFYIAIDALRSCLVTAILWLFTPCVTITIREPYIMVVWKTEVTSNFFFNSLFLTCECTVVKLDCALCCIHPGV